jgi:predicted lipid-binding transport protein (Tim44 family)
MAQDSLGAGLQMQTNPTNQPNPIHPNTHNLAMGNCSGLLGGWTSLDFVGFVRLGSIFVVFFLVFVGFVGFVGFFSLCRGFWGLPQWGQWLGPPGNQQNQQNQQKPIKNQQKCRQAQQNQQNLINPNTHNPAVGNGSGLLRGWTSNADKPNKPTKSNTS